MSNVSPLSYLGAAASTTQAGLIEIATIAETQAGQSSKLAVTPAGLASVAIAGAPDATTSTKGIIEISTNGEAAAKSASNLALVPSNIPFFMAAPGDIGGTTPGAGTFTTLTMTDLVLTNPLGVAEGGTNIASYTAGDLIYASGATTLSKLGIGTARQLLQTNVGATAPEWSSNIDVPGTLDVTGIATFDSTSSFAGTATMAAITASGLITGTAGATINGGAINLGSTATTDAVNIGTGAAAKAITIGNVSGATSVTVNSGTGGVAINSTGAGDIVLASADTVLIDGAGVVEINSSGAAIGIGNDAVAQPINIGTGAAARTITMGNTTGASAIVLNAGSGAVTCNTNLILGSVATQLQMNGGAVTDFIGTVALSDGAATVLNTNIDAADRIFISRVTQGAAPGHLSYTITPATSFAIASSSGTDNGTVAYFIVRQN